MLIAFVGDVHGRIFHALAALVTLRRKLNTRFDFIVQVGDMGFPDAARADEATRRYLAVDPAEDDLRRLIEAGGDRAAAVRGIRAELGQPIHFVRGNHEDFDWLRSLTADPATQTAPADAFDVLRYVPDGTCLDVHGFQVAFLGGVEELGGDAAIDRDAYESLLQLQPGAIDLLVTHEGPFASSRGYRGDVLGSRLISDLVELAQPQFHAFGHAHQVIGPANSGRTNYLGLDGLVASPLWHPEATGLKPGCMGLLDTATGDIRHIVDPWLGEFAKPFDFDGWAEATLSAGPGAGA